jgi:GH25 family lysozyme M1 (1,4-beta-N-acetylmuramidase)
MHTERVRVALVGWRRRALGAAAVLVAGLVSLAGSVPARRVAPVPVEIVSPQVVASIEAGRPVGFPVGGIDISSHDHRNFAMQWRTEIAAGSAFVYVKATEGTSYVNPHFAADYAAARAAHRYVGAYVFARPDLGDPVGQADHFLRYARYTRDARTLVPFVDLEWPYRGVHSGPCYNLTTTQMRAWIGAFLGRIETAVGRQPMIYTNTYWWNPCTGNDPSYRDHPLDIASYTRHHPRLPAGWTTFALWQYLPGDPGKPHSHDRDVVSGGLAGLRALAWPPQAG